MYIAFKWLLGLTVTMWVAMCGIDIFVKRKINLYGEEMKIKQLQTTAIGEKNRTITRTITITLPPETRIVDKNFNLTYLHCLMFVAGALVVHAYKHFNEITTCIKSETNNILTSVKYKYFCKYTKLSAMALNKAGGELCSDSWKILKNILYKSLKDAFITFKLKILQKQKINFVLLDKMREIGAERTYLAQLLLAAIHENKNIRKQYQLENMAKLRLVRHLEDTETLIKENRSRYLSFQQMYLVTHQENVYLKSRLKKLTRERNDVQKSLLDLMNQVYKSKSHELKIYCSRFIVMSKHNFLNTDVRSEIRKFLKNPQEPVAVSSNIQLTETKSEELVHCVGCVDVTDNYLDSTISFESDPKGVPTERGYVWTVKDKDGFIKKLFECDYGSNCKTGDTVRRIREYSVYHDKDCLLDFTNSSLCCQSRSSQWSSTAICVDGCGEITNDRFLTSSEAFKRFMRNNDNIVSTLPASY